MTYNELRQRHQEEVNNFPFVFAFTNAQLFKGMAERWNYTENDTDKIYNIGAGGFIRKEDAPKYREMCDRHYTEMQDALKDPGFFEEALYYELCNHEYCYTGDPEEALQVLGMTLEDVARDPARVKAYKSATRRAVKDCE